MHNSYVRCNKLILLIAGLSIARLSGARCLAGTCTSSVESSVQSPSLLQQSTARTAPAPHGTPAAATGQTIAPALPTQDRAHLVDVSHSSLGIEESHQANPLKESMPVDIATGVAELVNDAFGPEDAEVDEAEIEDLLGVRDEARNRHIVTALIDRDHKLIMGWSARAGCAATMNMFFENAGMYQSEDQEKYPSVHDYRAARGFDIQPTISDMEDPKFFKLKIVRNPYRRAVSSWAHQMETNFSYADSYQELATKNGVNQNSSFLEWLRFVNTVGTSNLDVHSKPQISAWERDGGKYDKILQLESPDFDDQLAEINAKSNSTLKFVTMRVSSFLSAKVNPSRRKDVVPRDETRRLIHKPAEELYKDAEAVKLVKEIYKEDFEAYGYSKEEPPVE